MAIVIYKDVPTYGVNFSLDGVPLDGSGVAEGEYVEIKVASRARAASLSEVNAHLVTAPWYIVLGASYNAMMSVTIDKVEGGEVLWEYSDGHGMRFMSVIRPNPGVSAVVVDYTVPGHHSHYVVKKRLRFTPDDVIDTSSERRREEAKVF